jgi:ATP-binding cassette subfamily B protein RaxB
MTALNLNLLWRRSVRPILQAEATECGLVCVAMVANYHGHRIDLPSIRRRFPISLKGATVKTVMALAAELDLSARPLRLEMEQLGRLATPCVLHWDMNHFVVLTRVSSSWVELVDPAIGRRRLALAEVTKHFTGVAIEFSPTAEFKPAEPAQKISISSLAGKIVGLRRALSQILILSLALEAVAIASPFYMQWLVDNALISGDRQLILVLATGFGLLVLLQGAISAFRAWVIVVISKNLNFQWLSNTFAHLMRLPLDYFQKRHLGDICSRFTSVYTIQQTLTTGFVQAIVDGLLVVGTLAVMLLYSPRLTAIAGLAVSAYIALRAVTYRLQFEATSESVIHSARQQTHFMESVRGVQPVRLFGRAEERRAAWMNLLAEQFNAEIRVSRITISFQTLNMVLFGLERVVVISVAGFAVLAGEMTIGMVFAYLAYKEQFSARVSGLVDRLFEFRMLRLHAERVADIALQQVERAGGAAAPGWQCRGELELKNIRYAYAPSEPDVLVDINLHVRAGEFVAIAGVSGVGKTTMAKVLLGLLRPTSGRLLIDDIPVETLGLEAFRGQVGAVMQDDFLFSGSLADNVSFFDPTPDPTQIERCARLAAIHDEISRMPMGYNTLVGDGGTGLSGGQRQRLLLARALYKKPTILVLDEATSHLDQANERHVNEALKNLNITRIVIAHRAETLALADRVVTLTAGQLRKWERPGLSVLHAT